MVKISKSKPIIIGILSVLLVIVLIVIGVFGYMYIGGNPVPGINPPPGTTYGYRYTCDVNIKENFWATSASIESVSCMKESKCLYNTFSILNPKVEGLLNMYDSNGLITTKNFDTGGLFSGEDRVAISGCVYGGSIYLQLFDKDRNYLGDKYEVMLN